MATFQVIKVRKANCTKFGSQHIVGVRTKEMQFYTNQEVIDSIEKGNKWVTSVPKEKEAVIQELQRCPGCTRTPYLTTKPDHTEKNNLENLPLDDGT